MQKLSHINPLWYCILFVLFGCKGAENNIETDAWRQDFEMDNSFNLDLIAREPLVNAPVALDFDAQGRIWVVEMIGFMPNIAGGGEGEASGNICILEDTNHDGIMDIRKVFLNELVLPRALLLYNGGLLYAEPPNLWFVEIEQDLPGKRTLVDSTYAAHANPEHQPNGLLLNLDNWIYSSKSNVRYRYRNGTWEKEYTAYRGQWGLTNDNEGRLFYNIAEKQFLGDYFLPQAMCRNIYLKSSNCANQQIVADQRVYPIQSTVVNRGYLDGILDEDEKLREFTSACGPLIYKGGKWGPKFDQNGYTCAPEANLIKRNVLNFDDLSISGKQAYTDKEFLISKDEGFRPVNLYDGPDGQLYIVDMHRGIIQHKGHMTDYLRQKTVSRQLDTIHNMGRIFRMYKKGSNRNAIKNISKKTRNKLIGLLSDQNSWNRNQAQRLLISIGIKNNHEKKLKKLAEDKNMENYGPLHALWTLEGLQKMDAGWLRHLLNSANPIVAAHAAYLLSEKKATSEQPKIIDAIVKARRPNESKLDAYLSNALGIHIPNNPADSIWNFYLDISQTYSETPQMVEMTVAGLSGREKDLRRFINKNSKPSLVWKKAMNRVVFKRKNNKPYRDLDEKRNTMDARTIAMQNYNSYCGSCHGLDAEGVENLGPPLNGSRYINGAVEKIILVTLNGLRGPIDVTGEGKRFEGLMPGFESHPVINDTLLSDIINYVRLGFANASSDCTPEKVKMMRDVSPPDILWTEESLEQKLNQLNLLE